ncbi:hypothetical protein WJN01_14125 [Flavobacteriaceae bacterium SZ-1-7]|uniref:hypothetical protein n=1 Tax=Tamlana sedimenti TaxID=3134126 RepID=UPI00312AD196
MKPTIAHPIFIFLYLLVKVPLMAQTMPMVYTPGPANLNPETLAQIYFLREEGDEFPENWLAVIINDDAGFCVKAKMNHIYRVHTKLTGPTRLRTKIKDITKEVILDLQPSTDYYITLKPIRQTDQRIAGQIAELEPIEGLRRLQAYNSNIQDRYCIVPMNGNHDFRENTWNDTIHWYAGKTHDYHFKPLPSWELLLRDKQKVALAFRNPLISSTYSEAAGIMPLSLKKCANIEAFENYCQTEFIGTILDQQQDININTSLVPVSLPDDISYARMITIENQNTSTMLPKTPLLNMRSCYIVFFWIDQKGKGYTATLYLSERGLAEELHPIDTLKKRLLWVWDSFKLVKTNKH